MCLEGQVLSLIAKVSMQEENLKKNKPDSEKLFSEMNKLKTRKSEAVPQDIEID